MNKRRFSILAIAIIIFLTCLPAFAKEAFVIDNYDIEIKVNEDNSYDVVENINTFFTVERHGIIRRIPLSNSERRYLIENITVNNDPYQVEANSRFVDIKIGDADVFVEGKKDYQIKYSYIVGKDNIADYDEFYFNIIGNEWDTDINNASFKVYMPKEFDTSKISITSGSRGSTSKSNIEYEVNGNVITGRLLGKLSSYQGITIALPLPEGYYTNVVDLNKGAGMIKFFAYIASGILIALAFLTWRRHGKDRDLFAPVQFYPPNNMTSAEIGYIIDGVVDSKDVTSLIILWASKGYIKIIDEDGSKNFTLVKQRNADDDMKMYEKVMFKNLFDSYGDGSKVTSEDLKNEFYATLNTTKHNVSKHFSGDKKLYTSKSKALRGLYHLLALVPCLLILFAVMYPAMKFSYDKTLYFVGIIGISVIIDITITVLMKGLVFRQVIKQGSSLNIRSIVGFIFSVLPGLLISFILYLMLGRGLVEFIFMSLACAIINLFAFIMNKRTEYGSVCSEQILGFKDFLLHAEKDRLEALVDENPEYFYNTLAYAIVLGVSDKWAKKFEKITLQPPSWYQGYYPGHYSSYLFYNRLNRSFNSMQSSMTSMPAPKSGGGIKSIGGGSVGGGSGGGGGSSW